MIRTILITGPIGSGKSAACRHLAGQGFPVYDCDSRTKALYNSVPGLKARIEEELGIPFCRLREIFADEGLRLKLEDIAYPLVIRDIEEWRRDCGDAETAFVESAVMLEKPAFDGLYDEVWMVEAPLSVRTGRNPDAAQRDALQHFSRNADKITRRIVNDGSLDELYKQLTL